MATTEVVFVRSADSTSGSKNGRNWTRWDLIDGTGRKISTFQAGPGEAAKSYVGAYAEIDYEAEQSGEYTNYKLLAIRATESSDSPAVTGQPTIPAVAPRGGGERRLLAAQAAFSFAGAKLLKATSEADFAAAETYALGLAERILEWADETPAVAVAASSSGGYAVDSDIPFGPAVW